MSQQPSTASKRPTIATVLAPTDLSAESVKAVRYATVLTEKFGAALHVLHVREIDFAIPGGDLLAADPDIERSLKQWLETARVGSIAPMVHGRTGRAFDQICRFAREITADLVVISTHGRTGLKRLFLGSNAERIVQHSSSPVLVVRQQEQESLPDGQLLHIQKILVPTDFSTSSLEALEYAAVFARQFGARLTLFHSFSIQEILPPDPYLAYAGSLTPEEARATAEDQMREFVKGIDFGGVPFDTGITMGRPAEEICAYAEQQKMDLIVTSTHGRTGFLHVLIGSVAEHIVREAHSPVLVVPGSIKDLTSKAP